jgi:hypothetical protein
MYPYPTLEKKTGKQLNPRPRPAPICYANDSGKADEREGSDDQRTHEIFVIFLAVFVTLSFVSLCAVIA